MEETHGPTGELEVQLSAVPGQGLNTMGNFIKEHITRILQPFGEHVDDLRTAVDQLQLDLVEAQHRAQKDSSQIEKHAAALDTVGPRLDSVIATAQTTQESVEKLQAQQEFMCEDLKETKTGLSKNCDLAAATESAWKETQSHLEETSGLVSMLSDRCIRTEDLIATTVQGSIADLSTQLEGLNERHAATLGKLNQTQEAADKTFADFQAFCRAYGMQKQKDDKRFAHVNVSFVDYGDMLKDTDGRVRSVDENLRTAVTMLKALRSKLDKKSDEMDATVVVGKQTADTLQSWLPDLEHMKRGLDKLEQDLKGNDIDNDVGVRTQVRKLFEALQRQTALVDSHEEILEKHKGVLGGASERFHTLEATSSTLRDRVNSLEDHIGIDHKGDEKRVVRDFVAAVKSYSILAKQSKLAGSVESQQGQLSELETKVAGAVNELETTKESLGKTVEALDACARKVGDLAVAQELTQEYWQGLSKGLRETHKSVALENSLLPPKTFKMTLPVSRNNDRPLTPGSIRAAGARPRGSSIR